MIHCGMTSLMAGLVEGIRAMRGQEPPSSTSAIPEPVVVAQPAAEGEPAVPEQEPMNGPAPGPPPVAPGPPPVSDPVPAPPSTPVTPEQPTEIEYCLLYNILSS